MYTLDIFRKNKINYSWSTVFVGRKLELLFPVEVSKYAVEYFVNHPDCRDSAIAELAYGVPTEQINELIKKVIKNIKDLSVEKDGPVWNLEKRKWRYCILTSLVQEITDHSILLDKISEAYSDFGYPIDMVEFIHYRPESGFDRLIFSDQGEIEKHVEMIIDNFKNFLQKEKIKILEKNGNWPDSGIYYPLD